MYRAVCYLLIAPSIAPEHAIPLRSAPVATRIDASAILDRLVATPDVTGGYLEVHVSGIGWCVSDPETDEGQTVGERGVW